MIPIKPPLRVRRELTHPPSAVFVALKERIRLDKIQQGWTPERAEWWAGRVIANPLLRYRFATVGVDTDEGE